MIEMKIYDEHKEIAKTLLDRIFDSKNMKNDIFICYEDTYRTLSRYNIRIREHRDILEGFLGDLSVLSNSLGLPMISAIVVQKSSLLKRNPVPGLGFFRLYHELYPDSKLSDNEIINMQVLEIKDCIDWYKLCNNLGIAKGSVYNKSQEVIEKFNEGKLILH